MGLKVEEEEVVGDADRPLAVADFTSSSDTRGTAISLRASLHYGSA